ncbi:MAG: nucleotidyltransferase domain-containing protein [Candidatus Omnitrophota bacterium]|nr:nucleotidyltransferase domain-containing protein [Candidatus Omnitrophota bacterium]
MQNKYIEKLKKAALAIFVNEDVKIILFGSRARNDSSVASDVDVGLIPRERLDKRKVLLLEEEVERLNIPYKVEIVDFSKTSVNFRKEAIKGAILWKD